MVYSFDVFDTLITRNVIKPTDLFNKISNRIEVELGKKLSDFSLERVSCERFVRKKLHKEEITLEDIYSELAKRLLLSEEEKLFIKKIEIEEECAAVYPIKQNVDLYNDLKKNNKVILITDMYLSKETIYRMLRKCDIDIDYSNLFVSSDLGITKMSGSIYKYISKTEGIKYSEWQHYGDNYHSDYRMAKKLGIKAKKIKVSDMNKYEKILLDAGLEDLALISKENRIKIPENVENNSLWEVAGSVIGPMLLGYLQWIYKYAVDEEIDEILFIARDGQLMYKSWQILYADDLNVKANYIYGSRQAWYVAGLLNIEDYFSAIGVDGWAELKVGKQYEDFYKNFHLDSEEIEKWFGNLFAGVCKSVEDRNHFYQVLESEKFCDAMLKKAERERSTINKYFNQILHKDTKNVALVDLGWTGQSLNIVKNILQSDNHKIKLHGFVLGKRCTKENTEWIHAWLINGKHRCLQSEVYLLETMFAADHGTTTGYKIVDKKVVPALKDGNEKSYNHSWNVKIQQDSVCEFIRKYVEKKGELSIHSNVAYMLFKACVLTPDIKAANAYRDYPFSTVIGDAESLPLARKMRTIDFFRELELITVLRDHLTKNHVRTVFWIEGTARMSGRICIVLSIFEDWLLENIFKIGK